MISAAGDPTAWAAVASAIVALVSLVYVAIGVRRSADADHVDRLEARVAECEKDRERLQGELTRMGQREVELMRLVVNLERRTET